ncbi:hypothetical protein [Brevibacterium casei]|uniref:Uncharacterized protein n=2 Tax=Brevibacterium casei TaxID=33889 RepID=A0A269ZC52_9MICO|nr:hypothetical protein [Brevibacterium casei]MCT1551987.1 hypothetical protein [Brevibacterium casei]MCT1561804.1 hypothetical protein [Brevibacterium casei]MCT2206647.1 hypothetical protein [Brevibacterium casei]PAK95171.1 hypothetical protein B8X04_10095 [Brevibacterium casei]QPR38390.1 hypothetical protein I6G94_12490 [Brevibacterium casei]
MNERPFHRPVPLADLESVSSLTDPVTRSETSHATAALLLGDARGNRDEAATRRFVELADDIGLEVIAEMWSAAPAVSAPGALWRLYALREWIVTSPREVADLFDLGRRRTTEGIGVTEILAGVENPVGPDEVARAIDEILAGAFRGDVIIALLRAAAFVGICAAGADSEDTRTRLQQLSKDLGDAAMVHRNEGLS